MAGNDTAEDGRANPYECQCPDCTRSKMHGERYCIRCYTDCKSEAGFGVTPAHD